MAPEEAVVAALDVGSSSVRALLYDGQGRALPNFGAQFAYELNTTADGGAEVPAEQLFALCAQCLTQLHGQLSAAGLRPSAVAACTFWHSFLGVDAAGEPVTPVLHLFDTRSGHEARELAQRMDAEAYHQRTGCVLHSSYWPAKLLWLSRFRPQAFGAAKAWVSFGDFLFRRVFGEAVESTSMVSGSGLWSQRENAYDEETLAALPITAGQLTTKFDEPCTRLRGSFAQTWPLLNGIPWFPAVGDGAANNIGSGCLDAEQLALMVGTSGALRAVVTQAPANIPAGLWCYRVDRKRALLGGALSNGGDVYAWMTATLRLPSPTETERLLQQASPGAHRLTMLPFLAGERSPYWRPDLRGAVCGLSLSTQPVEILQTALESVALRFRTIYDCLRGNLAQVKQVRASGTALLRSPAWTQMMADALGADITLCTEPEATSRGAALLALERIGALADLHDAPAQTGAVSRSRSEQMETYAGLLDEQKRLFEKLYQEK